MDITSDDPKHGFQFPGVFEISALGAAGSGLERDIPRLLAEAGIQVLEESISCRHSSGGNAVRVRLSFEADSRAQYEAAHEALRGHPEVKWTI